MDIATIFMLLITFYPNDDEPTTNVGKSWQPQFLLLALFDICGSRTMQLHISIGGVSLMVPIYTGSTHNVVAFELTKRVEITLHKCV